MKKHVWGTGTNDLIGYHSIAAVLASGGPEARYAAKIIADSLSSVVTKQYYNMSDGSGIYNRYGSAIGVKKQIAVASINN